MNKYEWNVYNYFKRKGLSQKYEHAGIYCIKIDDTLVYIGKSTNMLMRIAQHYVGNKTKSELKYRLLAKAQLKGHAINFDVLYYATTKYNAVADEIGKKEGEYIREYLPVLNTQIPKEEDYRKFTHRAIDIDKVLSMI